MDYKGYSKCMSSAAAFVIVPKPNSIVCLCLDPERLYQSVIRPMHRRPTLNDRLPKLINVCYMTIIDASSGYQNLNSIKNLHT